MVFPCVTPNFERIPLAAGTRTGGKNSGNSASPCCRFMSPEFLSRIAYEPSFEQSVISYVNVRVSKVDVTFRFWLTITAVGFVIFTSTASNWDSPKSGTPNGVFTRSRTLKERVPVSLTVNGTEVAHAPSAGIDWLGSLVAFAPVCDRSRSEINTTY